MSNPSEPQPQEDEDEGLTIRELYAKYPDRDYVDDDGELMSVKIRRERYEASHPSPTITKSPEEIAREAANSIRAHLSLGGYSQRAIEVTRTATGPSIQKANQVLPKILQDGILLIAGPTGTGKTVMATWLAWKRQEAGMDGGKFITAFKLFSTIKGTYNGSQENADQMIEEWSKCSLLVIDEVQTRGETAWEDAILEEIVNARYSAMKPTILIANIKRTEAVKALGPRISDRITECGGMIECNWASYRI